MSTPMRVSIVTPSFNRATFIRDCIESVRSQTHPHVEHIVVDGGSTDGTLEILRSAEASHGLKWISEADDGMYDAINKGLRMATGEILAYLNTDDLYFPWSVERAVSELEMGADVVYGDLCVLKRTNLGDAWRIQFYPGFNHRYFARFGAIGQPTVFLKRRAFEAVGSFGGTFKLLGDCDYWLRCAEAGFRPRKVDEVLALQIDHGMTLRETQARALDREFCLLSEAHGYAPSRPPYWTKRIVAGLAARQAKWRYLTAHFGGGASPRWARFREAMRGSGAAFSAAGVLGSLFPASLVRGSNSGYDGEVTADWFLSLCTGRERGRQL